MARWQAPRSLAFPSPRRSSRRGPRSTCGWASSPTSGRTIPPTSESSPIPPPPRRRGWGRPVSKQLPAFSLKRVLSFRHVPPLFLAVPGSRRRLGGVFVGYSFRMRAGVVALPPGGSRDDRAW